ncbi:MAG: TSUP family transporter [Lachnospiraceae bacterium]|nr:TSUP family transporter [Lachnospiraceae bacterium]
MNITFTTYLILCPLVFLGAFVDSIGGGGGLISLPAYLLCGLPPHMAIATNKLSSACGTTISTLKFAKEKLINYKLAVPTILTALLGSAIGAKLSLFANEDILKIVLVPVLFIAAFFVLNKNLFGKEYDNSTGINVRTYIFASVASLVIGMYDGFYGPGTGTFLIIVLNLFAHLNIRQANAQTKTINLTTNLTSLTVFIINGQVVWKLGIVAAVFGIAGNYLGAGLAIKNAGKITRPVILVVLAILLIKILFE